MPTYREVSPDAIALELEVSGYYCCEDCDWHEYRAYLYQRLRSDATECLWSFEWSGDYGDDIGEIRMAVQAMAAHYGLTVDNIDDNCVYDWEQEWELRS